MFRLILGLIIFSIWSVVIFNTPTTVKWVIGKLIGAILVGGIVGLLIGYGSQAL